MEVWRFFSLINSKQYSFSLGQCYFWFDCLLVLTRDASYTTQPLELLNDLGFENRKQHRTFSRDLETPSSVTGDIRYNHHHIVSKNGTTVGITFLTTSVDRNGLDHSRETEHQTDTEGSEG